jgi:hypothetical protein
MVAETAFDGLWFRSEGYGAKEECVDTGWERGASRELFERASVDYGGSHYCTRRYGRNHE